VAAHHHLGASASSQAIWYQWALPGREKDHVSSDGSIHQLVGFLAAYGPAELEALSRQHPDTPDLRPGRILGSLSAPWTVRVQLASRALRLMAAQGDSASRLLASRLRSSHRVELIAQVAAAVGSGGALAALLGEGSDTVKLAGAGLGLVGSVTAAAVKFLRRDLSGSDNGLAALHAALVQAVARAVELGLRLEPYAATRDDLGEPAILAGLVDEANTLAGRLFQQMHQAGLPGAALQAT
jgi:hypothetical protein